ncbi:hypothetical protein SASPL_120913 [Salvia splendens]|uniref:Polycomb protein VEFS-Box domain-containing protein n=1 Tax=Salvia splendens TaxID=180675 RepID=A0A8X8ZWQ2_SALSN|nr:hypothetical protein SASPL_120913 [Salvia splendens]
MDLPWALTLPSLRNINLAGVDPKEQTFFLYILKQRVLADGHISWACEAFSELHKQDLVLIPALLWCWILFMIKLWNHGLLDARTMNICNIILEQPQGVDADADTDLDT